MNSLFPGEEEMLGVLDVLALSDESIFVIDDHHKIVFWNRGMQRLLGYTHDEIAGRSCSSVLAGDDTFGNRYCSEACPVQLIAQQGGAVRNFRLSVRSKTAGPVPLDVAVLKFTLRTSRKVLLAHIVRPSEKTEAAEAASAEPPRPNPVHADARVRELTTREIEILGMLAAGQQPRVIAGRLGISHLTTRNHIQHIFEKLEVHSQSEAVAFAYRMKLIGTVM